MTSDTLLQSGGPNQPLMPDKLEMSGKNILSIPVPEDITWKWMSHLLSLARIPSYRIRSTKMAMILSCEVLGSFVL